MLLSFGSAFFDEAGFGQFCDFDMVRAAQTMEIQIRTGMTPFVIAEIEGNVAGMISYSMDHVFTARPIAYLHMIYVLPPYRRTPLARKLVAMALWMAAREDACAFFATVAPTSKAARALCNLFRRAGFEPMGGSFTRKL